MEEHHMKFFLISNLSINFRGALDVYVMLQLNLNREESLNQGQQLVSS